MKFSTQPRTPTPEAPRSALEYSGKIQDEQFNNVRRDFSEILLSLNKFSQHKWRASVSLDATTKGNEHKSGVSNIIPEETRRGVVVCFQPEQKGTLFRLFVKVSEWDGTLFRDSHVLAFVLKREIERYYRKQISSKVADVSDTKTVNIQDLVPATFPAPLVEVEPEVMETPVESSSEAGATKKKPEKKSFIKDPEFTKIILDDIREKIETDIEPEYAALGYAGYIFVGDVKKILAELGGFKSPVGAARFLRALKEKGFIFSDTIIEDGKEVPGDHLYILTQEKQDQMFQKVYGTK